MLMLGGGWTVLFGLLYGEALGSLGHSIGMPALWFYRGGPTALEPLLLFSLAIGLVHVVLGLLLGVWTAARGHHASAPGVEGRDPARPGRALRAGRCRRRRVPGRSC